jgi:copper transport protein
MAFKIKSLFVVIPLVFLIIVIPLFYMPEITTVKGHAIPDSYTLEPNSLLKKSESFPSSISILFSERPEPKISYIHVTNSDGERIDNNDFKITGKNDRRGTVTVDKSLIRDGIYSVSWSTMSLDDGHVAKGTYVVGVGVGSSLPAGTVPATVTDNNILYSPKMAIVKIPIVLGQVYVLGFVFSQLFIWKDIHKQELRNIIDLLLRRRFTNSILIISLAMVGAATLIPVFQSSTISETQSDYFKNLALLYFETTNGMAWLIRIISCIIIAFAAYYYGRAVKEHSDGFIYPRSRNKGTILLFILLTGASIFIATNSITSHSSSIASWSQLGIITDFVHTIVVSIWIGGLMYIPYVLLPNLITISNNISGNVQQIIAQPKSILMLILSRFSVVSTICVGVVGITGLFLAWLHIQNIDELLLSNYGRTLIVKLSLILPVVILGGYHQFWISRKLKLLDFERVNNVNYSNNRSSIQSFSSLKTSVKIECILALGVLCVASFLTVTSPPTDSQNNEIVPLNPNGDMSSGVQDELVRTLETQGIHIRLVISPFVTGFNNFTVNILGNTESIGQFSNASIEFRKSDLSLGPVFANLAKNNETSYSVNGGYLSQPGLWHVKVTVKRPNSYDLNYRTSFTLNKSGGSESLHEQHHVDSREVLDDDNPNHTSSFTPMVIGLSVVVAILSAYFCIKALKRLRTIQQYLGLHSHQK